MPDLIDFNLNNHVRVKLTDIGREELKRQWKELNKSANGMLGLYKPIEEDEDGWSRWQAWCLMKDLGHLLNCGMHQPFETTIQIEIDGWRPIETAPKDEDDIMGVTPHIILGFAPDEENYTLPSVEGYWRSKPYKKAPPCFVSCMDPDVPYKPPQPTHWKPMPSHPTWIS